MHGLCELLKVVLEVPDSEAARNVCHRELAKGDVLPLPRPIGSVERCPSIAPTSDPAVNAGDLFAHRKRAVAAQEREPDLVRRHASERGWWARRIEQPFRLAQPER